MSQFKVGDRFIGNPDTIFEGMKGIIESSDKEGLFYLKFDNIATHRIGQGEFSIKFKKLIKKKKYRDLKVGDRVVYKRKGSKYHDMKGTLEKYFSIKEVNLIKFDSGDNLVVPLESFNYLNKLKPKAKKFKHGDRVIYKNKDSELYNKKGGSILVGCSNDKGKLFKIGDR